MVTLGESFDIQLHDIGMKVTPMQIGNDEVYRIEFSDNRPPLVVAEVNATRPFWTSLPRGRQIEADYFGKRIEEYLKKK